MLASGIKYENNIPSQVIYDLFESESSPITITGYTAQRGNYLQFFNYSDEDMMLVASQNGSLDLYQIDFSTYTAELRVNDFLGFSDNPANRNLNVAVVQKSNPDLYAVDQIGELIKIENFMESSSRSEVLIQIGEQSLPTLLGRNTWIAPIGSPFDETFDLVLGTRGGGLIYLSSTEESNTGTEDYQVKVYPNPSEGPVKVLVNKESTGTLINSLGQELVSEIEIPANIEIEIQANFLAPGLYILLLESGGKFRETRKIWMR